MRQLILSALLGIGSCLAVAQESARFSGTAHSSSGDVLYHEKHRVEGSCSEGYWQPRSHEVSYLSANEENEFASKSLDYRSGLIRPEVDFRQPRFEETMEITPDGAGKVTINWQPPEEDQKRFETDAPSDLVIDAGFDHFIRQHWDDLTSGETVSFRILAPTRGEHYGFVAEPADDDAIDAKHVFRIRPSGLIARFLVDPILLGYDQEGFLTDYSGLTNIRENKERNYTAHIRYKTETPSPCPRLP